jgi:hypothetical protein
LHEHCKLLPLYAHEHDCGAGQTVTPSPQLSTQIKLLPPP